MRAENVLKLGILENSAHGNLMENPTKSPQSIPSSLATFFQEYEFSELSIQEDANLIIQRTLEFGDWDEIRWLFEVYRAARIRTFLRHLGERSLRPPTFNYWRQLMRIRKWEHSPFDTPKGELWKF